MKASSFLLLLLFALGGAARAEIPAPPDEIAGLPVVLLVDAQSGQTLYARKPGLSFVPASMTKVMTAFVAFEEISEGRLSVDRKIAVSADTAREWSGRGTSMYLQAGEEVPVHDLLRGIMTASANDASVVLAEGYAGSVPAWSFMMNDAARRLGMKDSAFNNPNGWPDEGRTYVSARDLVTLAHAMISRFPGLYRRYSGQTRMNWRGRALYSHDPVTGVVPGADGIKTGYTREAGYNFLGSAERDGRRLVMVVAGAKSDAHRAEASRALLEWGFSEWRERPLFEKGTIVGRANVQGGSARSVALVGGTAISATVPKAGEEEVSLAVVYRGPIEAPIAKGARVAELEIRIGDLPPSRVPLFAKHGAASAGPMDRLLNGLMNLFS